MDTSDPNIIFDKQGFCNHCTKAMQLLDSSPYNLSKKLKQKTLNKLIRAIKKQGKEKQYNCIIGISGGVDSTYVAYTVKKLGLRPLAVHLDNGWDSELAQKNIENILKKLDIDLYTYVIDWEEFRDLQLSFLKASTPDAEIPSDHAIVATLYKTALKHNVKYIIWGMNISTESLMPVAWSHGHADWKYISSIQKRFGKLPLETFPHFSIFDFLYYQHIAGIKTKDILNYVEYKKEKAIKVLEKELGWRYYGGKHYESVYTRFYQAYILPKKFGFDKRKAHLSSMICSNQITRNKALKELEKDTYSKSLLAEDKEYVIKKLNISKTEFEKIMKAKPKTFWNYPSYNTDWYFKIVRKLYKLLFKI
jgi:N-acetyl sugar amidotransferase